MKFTLSWLKDHLQTDSLLENITDKLTSIGFEVEQVDDKSTLKYFLVAKIISTRKHPDAEKLQILEVDSGAESPLQVVCGAPNAREGLLGVFAPPGSYIPGLDLWLKIARIRGVESHGMMCSEKELNLSSEHGEIIELPADSAPVGTGFAAYAGLDDPVVQINLTANRSDAAGVHSIARDLSATGIGTLKNLTEKRILGVGKCPIKVHAMPDVAGGLCRGGAFRMIRGVKNRASPLWLQRRLLDIGLRPVNALVDVTNYIMFDCARPLHVFDAAKIKGDLTIRRAQDGEKILALDGREYTLSSEICVIADKAATVSIAGIIGGKESSCDDETSDVLIESALWNGLNVARTGRALGILTDARYRFERGVDPEFMIRGLEKATSMIMDLCGGEPTEIELVFQETLYPKIISFPFVEIKRLSGIDIEKKEATDILSHLGFSCQGSGDIIDVIVPSWRNDVTGKADLVEEIIRIYGFEKITPKPLEKLSQANNLPFLSPLQICAQKARRALAVRGMMEALTWSFISEQQAGLFAGKHPTLRLSNPVSVDMSCLRPSLLPGLILASGYNTNIGIHDLALFEISSVYHDEAPHMQRLSAAGLRKGTAHMGGAGRHWSGSACAVNVFTAKEDALAVLDACNISSDKIKIESGGPDYWHPGRSGTLKLRPDIILGVFGEFHPETLEKIQISGPLAGFEIFLDALPHLDQLTTKAKKNPEISSLQPVKRDFAFVVDSKIPASAIINAALEADKKFITNISVFDVFEDVSLGEGKKSIAIEVTIQPMKKTFLEEELQALSSVIIEAVNKRTKGVLRSS